MPKIHLTDFRGGMIRDVDPLISTSAPRKKLGVRELAAARNVVITDEGKVKTRNGFRYLADVPNAGNPQCCVQFSSTVFYLYTTAGFFQFTSAAGMVEKSFPIPAVYDGLAIDDVLYFAALGGILKYTPATDTWSAAIAGSPSGQPFQLIYHRDRLWTFDFTVPNVVQATAIGDYEDWTNGYSVELYEEGQNCTICGLASVGDDLFILTDAGVWLLSGYGESSFSLSKISSSFRTTTAKIKTIQTANLAGFGECVMFVDRDTNVCAANRGGVIKVCEGYGRTRPALSASTLQWASFLSDSNLYLVSASSPIIGSLSEELLIAAVHCNIPFRAKSGKTQWPVTQFKTADASNNDPIFISKVSSQLYSSVPNGTEMALLFFLDDIDSPTSLKVSTFFQCNRDTTGFFADDYWGSKYSQVPAYIMLPPIYGEDREPRRWIEMEMTTGKVDSTAVSTLILLQYMDETMLYPQSVEATTGLAGTRTQNKFSFLLYGFSETTQLLVSLYDISTSERTLPYDHSMEVQEIAIDSE